MALCKVCEIHEAQEYYDPMIEAIASEADSMGMCRHCLLRGGAEDIKKTLAEASAAYTAEHLAAIFMICKGIVDREDNIITRRVGEMAMIGCTQVMYHKVLEVMK